MTDKNRVCKWSGCTTPINGKGNIKYCEHHRLEAKREKTRIRVQRYYQNNKLHQKLKDKGTINTKSYLTTCPGPTYLGNYIPFHEFYQEYIDVNKLKNITFSKSVSGNNRKIECNGTHQYVTTNDYHTFNVSYTMRAYTKCLNPECPTNTITGATGPILLTRDLKHCETVCQTCGTVLNYPGMKDTGKGGRMAVTNVDIFNSGIERQSIQSIARNRYWEHTSELLERCIK